MRSPAVLLQAQDIARRHPDRRRWLLREVSLAIQPRTRLAVSGPSGSGKTLLLRALALLDPVEAGTVHWMGRAVPRDRIPAFRAAVAYLHQRPTLIEETVAAALKKPFSLAVHHRRGFDRQRVEPLLERLGRDGSFLAKRTGDLSGGEAQIAALLRLLQLDPTVLLLDEPTAALDPRTAGAIEGLLVDWVQRGPDGRALVWVTHDAAQAERVAQSALRMHSGRLEG